jgi:hypothetical protein
MSNNNPIRLTTNSFANALVLRCDVVLRPDRERHRDV